MAAVGRFMLLFSVTLGTCLSATVVRGPVNSTVSVGQTAFFTCTFSSDWQLITWSMKEKLVLSDTATGSGPIVSDPRLNHSYTNNNEGVVSTLTISRVLKTDAGSVRCSVQFTLESDTKVAYLIVQDKEESKDWLIIAIVVPIAVVILLLIIILIIVICKRRKRATQPRYSYQGKTSVLSKNPAERTPDGQSISWLENTGNFEEDTNSIVDYTGYTSPGFTDIQSQRSSRTVLNNTSEAQNVNRDSERQWPILNQPSIVPKNTKHVTTV